MLDTFRIQHHFELERHAVVVRSAPIHPDGAYHRLSKLAVMGGFDRVGARTLTNQQKSTQNCVLYKPGRCCV